MFILQPRSRVAWFAGLIVAIQVALDVHAIAGIKAGHLYGFVAGLLVSLVLWFLSRSKAQSAKPESQTSSH
ncbi:hypothetical protein [Undibacterium sp. Ji83W]|uniref:hypothetical protein n=1 Tax=Undibacterium sp. Ji83W TaxID=3413043 RepID=UPI003BF5E398